MFKYCLDDCRGSGDEKGHLKKNIRTHGRITLR
jgi:hypothetical protein